MIKLVKSYPPIFEFEVEREGVPTIIKAKALFWNYYDEDARQDKLKTSIERFAFEKNLDCWLYVFEYQQLDEWTVQAKKLVGDDEGLVSRKDLLAFYGITGPALNYRINNTNHPKPIVIKRKHWFSVDACDQWIADQKTK